MTEVSTMQL